MTIVQQSDEFRKWFKELKDQVAKAKILIRIKRLATGNMGDVKHFDGITELRINYGPGYRVYVARKANTVYLLLCGGDKSSQQKDIEKAKKILTTNSSSDS